MSTAAEPEIKTTSMGLMNSLMPECTPLKYEYDKCFNFWFKGYLETASVADKEHALQDGGSWTRGMRTSSFFSGGSRSTTDLASMRERYEKDCGKLFAEYQACVKRAVKEKGLDHAIEKARVENPFPLQHER